MSEEETITFNIKELDPDIIPPCTARANDPEYGGSKIVLIGRPGCFAEGTEVLMYDKSIKKVEDVELGDQVMGDDMTPRTVLHLCRGNEGMVSISIFSEETKECEHTVIVNLGHYLVLYNTASKVTFEITVREFLTLSEHCRQFYSWIRHIPVNLDTPIKDSRIISNSYIRLTKSFKIKSLSADNYYGFTLDGNHRFLLSDYSVVRNSGKSSCIASLLYAKKHIFPVGMVMSGTEATTGFFKKIFPSTFVFNEYREDMLDSFVKRQKIAKEHLPNPWAILLVDDCVESRKVLASDIQMNLFKMGRHYKTWYLLSMQSPTDLPGAIKTSIDGVFIFREPLHTARKIIWENYASIIPKEYFNQIMDQITNDHTALFILNNNTSNDWQDNVFWYKAPLAPSGWKFGTKEYKEYHNERYDEEYTEGF